MFVREKYLILPILIPTPQWSRHFNAVGLFVVKVGWATSYGIGPKYFE